MRVVILYRPKSEHARAVETFVHDFKRRHDSARVELLNVDEREGIATLNLYGIMQYPAIIALADDGVMLQLWQGSQLPLMDEVAAYLITSHNPTAV